ncbi:MarR family winged helix-turn-helix transcriptional regulator [Paenibacillus sp. D51F]
MKEELLPDIIKRYEAASFVVTRRFNALIQEKLPEDLTREQFGIVRYLNSRGESGGGCTSTELADAFCVGKSTITSLITRLVDKELIQRNPDGKDRRVTFLSLTDKGIRTAKETDRIIKETLGRYIQAFEDEEALQFIEMFEFLADKLKN